MSVCVDYYRDEYLGGFAAQHITRWDSDQGGYQVYYYTDLEACLSTIQSQRWCIRVIIRHMT